MNSMQVVKGEENRFYTIGHGTYEIAVDVGPDSDVNGVDIHLRIHPDAAKKGGYELKGKLFPTLGKTILGKI